MPSFYDSFDNLEDESFLLQLKGINASKHYPHTLSRRGEILDHRFARQKPKLPFSERWMVEVWGTDPKNWPQWLVDLQKKAREYLKRTRKNHRTSA